MPSPQRGVGYTKGEKAALAIFCCFAFRSNVFHMYGVGKATRQKSCMCACKALFSYGQVLLHSQRRCAALGMGNPAGLFCHAHRRIAAMGVTGGKTLHRDVSLFLPKRPSIIYALRRLCHVGDKNKNARQIRFCRAIRFLNLPALPVKASKKRKAPHVFRALTLAAHPSKRQTETAVCISTRLATAQ